MITLPTIKIPAETQDPKYLILFGLPKVGKTTVLSTLENNLILDFAQLGSGFQFLFRARNILIR